MYKKLLILVFFIGFQSIKAQDSTVSGTVTDTKGGNVLPGVNVVVKGTSVGVLSDFDGNYSIKLPTQDAILVFSSLGFETKEIAVNGQTTINVSLSESAQQLDEVIVTALGIERDRKALGYAVTQLQGESISEVKTSSALNALQGKVAGVNITPPSTGAAGSSRVIIRGASSLSGGNQPLYVVDGVTIDNTQLGAASEWGGSDFGDGISSINPDDVESVSVLKGGAAGALYGSRASNGVILITTKNGGKQKGFGVEYSSQITFDKILNNIRDFQNTYGQGSQGVAPTTAQEGLQTAFSSWGPRLGSIPTSVQFDGVSRPYVDTGNNLDKFYDTGTTLINTIAISKNSDNFNYRFAATNFDNKDVLPNSELDRKSFSLNLGSVAAEKLSLDLSARYIIEKVTNRPRVSDAPGNANFSAGLLPANVNIENLAPGFNEDGVELQISSNPFVQNPYWAAERFRTFDRRNRILSSATLKYQILDWLDITARAGIDHATTRTTQIEGYGTAFTPLGSIEERENTITQVDADLILGINKNITDDLVVKGFFGVNKNTQRRDFLKLRGERFVVPFLEILGNVENTSNERTLTELAFAGVYGSVELGYKDFAYLTVTGRNDWFSTLSAAGKTAPNNDFYPSISGSFVFSNAFEMPDWLTFGRVRLGYSEVAGGAETPYQLSLPFRIFGQGHQGEPLGEIATGTLPNNSLTPFSKEEIEVGLDLSFLNGRLGVDFAYYDNKTEKDILPVDISNTSGFSNVLSNIGILENRGVELLFRGTPVQTKNFRWNVNYNLTFNESEIVATDDNNNILTVGNVRTFDANVSQIVGEPFGVIYGTAYTRNAAGQIVYGADGLPIESPDRQILGEGVPPWTMGLTNTFSYKNINLSFLVDAKFGGQVYAGTNAIALSNGLDKRTLAGRESGLTVTGVDEAGNPFTFTHDNSTLQAYYNRISGIAEEVIEDADFIKLRQVSLGYTFPSSLLSKTFITGANVSLIGRNLFFIKRDSENIDPEAGFNGGNAQGLEYFGLPSIASYGLTVNLKF
ncbi:SusC/RagA family TonB-linked outer membrane protein [Aquimarina sp. 2201CG5-10]|uniref:SusC/RagA family TonB-linked outer membrane protein n=1 Tax=Aquimarina callyspongiae TaxID=3098150 RepID=UPI002AB4C454|nr:SusC/RagA family TonB-linked outer membrane protein [Aquimarina sp. 2201CG5-10]MDY8138398.1 SusC/RagA family TonB-linked outer membrane protein [Aquimarina sp. 2201CG5-10]